MHQLNILVIFTYASSKAQTSLSKYTVLPEPLHTCDQLKMGMREFSSHFRKVFKKCVWAMMQENLSSGFPAK